MKYCEYSSSLTKLVSTGQFPWKLLLTIHTYVDVYNVTALLAHSIHVTSRRYGDKMRNILSLNSKVKEPLANVTTVENLVGHLTA